MSRLIRVDEAAARLGVSEITVRRMLSTGQLPCVRPRPRVIRVREDDLEALMRVGYRPVAADQTVGA
jgi:excisionase family DNA binding protein